jgi:hypothetical protein
MIAGSSLLSVLITLVIVGLIFWLLWWFIGYVCLPEPFNKVAKVIIGLVALIFLINLLLGFSGHPLIRW